MENYTIRSVVDFMQLVSQSEFEKVFNAQFKEGYDEWLIGNEDHPEYIGLPATIDSFIDFCWDNEYYESDIIQVFLEERDELWVMNWDDYAEHYIIIKVGFPNAVDQNDLLYHVLKQGFLL